MTNVSLSIPISNLAEKSMAKNILSLSSNEVMSYFMKSNRFHNFELPEYFTFDKVLDFVKDTIGDKTYEDCLSDTLPDDLNDVNMDLLTNKDGKYGVRPLTLANPYLYYFLVREVCGEKGWKASLDCFEKFNVPHITSCALPIVEEKGKKEPFHNSATILNWWNSIEQRSLELSLEYRYMFVTDITNCYGSINPQSIDWAMSCKGTSCSTDGNHEMATNIIRLLAAFQHGRNIGIPQGSIIFDFIGEFVLGYSDLLLHEALEKEGITGYEILRYRDDYRVFCNDRDTLEKISYKIQHILETLNFRLNSSKTKISENIVTDSIKSDKLWYIKNTPIFNKKGVDFDGIQKHLLYILMFGREYPNGGQLKTMLSDLDKRVIKRLKPKKRKKKVEKEIADGIIFSEYTEETIEEPGKIVENIRAIVAIGTQIAIENVSVVHYALCVISRIVDSMEDNNEKRDILEKVIAKLCKRPNSAYDQIWLQNISYQQDKKVGSYPYDVRLCHLVMGKEEPIWNTSWLKPELTADLPLDTICDSKRLKELTPVITFRETRNYYEI